MGKLVVLTLSLPRPRDGPGKVTGTELPLKESGNLLKVLSLSSSGWVPLANQAQICPPPQAPPPASCSLGSHRVVLGWARTSDSSPSPECGPGPRFLTFKCGGVWIAALRLTPPRAHPCLRSPLTRAPSGTQGRLLVRLWERSGSRGQTSLPGPPIRLCLALPRPAL